jgi:isopenicillin N synthase-like dioxygenase
VPEFPTIDLSHYDPRRVDLVCRETGFVAIVGHGLPQALIRDVSNASRAFFDLPLEDKLAVAMPYVGYPYGYAPYEGEALAQSLGERTAPDLKETFSIGPPDTWEGDSETPTLWPARPPELEGLWRRYFEEMGRLAARLMSVFATALDLPEDFFASKIDRHASALRILNYPAVDAPPRPGQLRAGAHSDYGSLTILCADAGSRGLEIRRPDGSWQEVPIVEGAFIVNVGDLLARWSNDRWVSTVHRVTCADRSRRRQSIAFFHLPNWDAEIACIPTCLGVGEKPKHPPVQAGAHLMQKFRSAVTLKEDP